MFPFRQLVSTLSLAFVVLQAHQNLHGSGQALAQPVQLNSTDVAAVITTQARESIPELNGDGQNTNVEPEAVLKALQALADGMSIDDNQVSSSSISHGEGGPIDSTEATSKNTQDNDPKKKNSSKTGSDNIKTKDSKKNNDNAKATQALLQQPRTRFCAQPTNTNRTIDDISTTLVKAERKRLANIRQRKLAKSKTTDARSLTDARILADAAKSVQVVWHVIHSGSSGNLSDATIASQMTTLNQDYASFGFNFTLNTTDRVNNANWFNNVQPGTSLQDQMKASLRQGDQKTLNLYSVNFGNNLLGYSTFPWDVQGDLSDDGVVFQYSTVPGGGETGYDLGKTLTHEVGHWLGLYHVFQGGCRGQGDFVADTPPQSTATSGCPVGQDSCRGGGVDSIHNYMDYSSDACLTEFTEGQAVRMAALTAQYRSL